MPFSPGQPFLGGHLIAQGLTNFGAGIGAGLQARQARLDQLKKQNAAAKGLRAAFENLGLMEREELEAMDFNTLAAFGMHAPSLLSQPMRQQQLKASKSAEARADNADARAERADARAEEVAPINKELLENRLMQGEIQSDLLQAELDRMNKQSQGLGLALPEGLELEGATVGKDGAVSYSYKAKGTKELTQTEVLKLASLEQAERDLDALEQFFDSKKSTFGGPIEARVKNFGAFFFGPDPDVKQAETLAAGSVPGLARGVFGEVGVLSDADRRAYAELLPAAKDTPEVRRRKFADLRKRLSTQVAETKKMLAATGRDVSGLEDDTPAPTGVDKLRIDLRRGASGDFIR